MFFSPFYTSPQLQRNEYTKFLVMMDSAGGLTRKRYLWRVEQLVNIVLMSCGIDIFRVFSARPFAKNTMVNFLLSFSIVQFRFPEAGVMLSV